MCLCYRTCRSTGTGRRRRRRHLELRALRHHALEANSDALNDREQNGTANRTVAYRPRAPADCERAAGEAAGDDWVPGVFFAADALDGAVEGREQTSPYAEVATEDR